MLRTTLIWIALLLAVFFPLGLAVSSPLLQWRSIPYILAGFSGVLGLCILLIQPLLVGRYLPGLSPVMNGRIHRIAGTALVLFVIAHVAGLWFSSPPDVIDALLFRSPTPFSAWGVIAMWAVFATGILALTRRRLGIRFKVWRFVHLVCGAIIVSGTIIHALLIEGTMETTSKVALCIAVGLAFIVTTLDMHKRNA